MGYNAARLRLWEISAAGDRRYRREWRGAQLIARRRQIATQMTIDQAKDVVGRPDWRRTARRKRSASAAPKPGCASREWSPSAGKRRSVRVAVCVGHKAKHACRVEGRRAEPHKAPLRAVLVRSRRRFQKPDDRRSAPELTPVKRGMRQKDLQAAHQQDGHAKRVDPMGDARRQRVAMNQLSARGRRRARLRRSEGSSSDGLLS